MTGEAREMENNLIFLYPGQGSHYRGMGYDIYESFPEARNIFDRADGHLDFSLRRLCFEGSDEELNSDLNAQLAVYTISCAITEVLRAHRIEPLITSGYSSGFYAAAYAAGCFDFTDGLDLVKRAGEILLDEGGNFDGCMAVIFGLSGEQTELICRRAGTVQVAIRNTSRQIIVSGLRSSVSKAMEIACAEGALDAYFLAAETAYHSILMANSSLRFHTHLNTINIASPRVPLLSYSSLDLVTDGEKLKKTMADQLSSPVLWVDVIKKLRLNDNFIFIEVGPGSVIYRTVRWIDRTIEAMITDKVKTIETIIEKFVKKPGCWR